jgi:prevent-host-death family protein
MENLHLGNFICTFKLYKIMGFKMNMIAVSDLRANLMKVLKKINHGATINITSRGKIVAVLIPPAESSEKAKQELKELGKKAIIGDIISPIDGEWDAMK